MPLSRFSARLEILVVMRWLWRFLTQRRCRSVLKNGVERFMLSFVGAGNALSVAMHMRNHT